MSGNNTKRKNRKRILRELNIELKEIDIELKRLKWKNNLDMLNLDIEYESIFSPLFKLLDYIFSI